MTAEDKDQESMTRDLVSATSLTLALLLSLSHVPTTLAQETPRTADGRPDLSGYWSPPASAVRII